MASACPHYSSPSVPKSAIHMMAFCLALVPINSLGFNQPSSSHLQRSLRPSHRPSSQQRCCLGHRRVRQRNRKLILSMRSFDDDSLPTKEKKEFNGDEDIGMDSKLDLSERNKQNLIKEELEDDEQYNLLEDRADLEDDMKIALNRKIKDDPNLIDNFWTWALQLPSESNIQRRAPRKNRRMQMFAYLSQPIVEVRVIGLVFLSCFLEAINTLDDLPSGMHQSINAIDTVCVYIFAVEFFLRWWSAGRFQLRYLAKPLAAIDAIVVILPLILSGFLPVWDFGVMTGVFPYGVSLPGWLLSSSLNSSLLNLRLLRILKFQRVLTDENTYMNFELALGMKKTDVRPYQLQLARVLISISTLVSVSTGLIYTAEHEVNPQIPDYFTALYFGLTTLTTVGFGDITPVTAQGRLVVGGSILAGVAIIPAQAASLAEAYLDFQKERYAGKGESISKAKENTIIIGREKCDKCGVGPHRNDAFFCWSCG
eukprot:CAMPEP_0172315506 /NCGR_PEP_ID=MMETSP1058-20130122/25409_1 /TAXON_ID=83371 /ORGANISM="Detonula confervacea, Strain CCMP 353" /LENGTH=481 /DNA_ID=CAMNT_0013029591 /DNA_START=6 /DNA_END=1448 /DNA_ORIENTATION=+